MRDYKENSVKTATYERMNSSLELMLKYDVADIPIDKLTSLDLQRYVNQLVRDGYALTTIKKQLHLISGYITYANLSGDILKPIHKGVELPNESSVRKHRKGIAAYDEFEQTRLLKVLRRGDSPIFQMAMLMMETGMRVGEVLALTWDDVDWRRRAIRISKTIVKSFNRKRAFVQNSPKSFSSNRTIPLSSRAYELLEELRPSECERNAYIFSNKRGDFLSYESVRWWIRKACEESGVPYYGAHVFRHTFATNCYRRGCDVKVLSKLLGHSDVATTYNTYIHLYGDALEQMRAVLG